MIYTQVASGLFAHLTMASAGSGAAAPAAGSADAPTAVYQSVIDAVCTAIRPRAVSEGVEDVIQELKKVSGVASILRVCACFSFAFLTLLHRLPPNKSLLYK
jgi:hypothetical protein